MSTDDTNAIKELLESSRENLANAPKGTQICKKYFKLALDFCLKMINNGDEKYIYIGFLIYLLDLCDYYEAMIFLKTSLELHKFLDNELKQELSELYLKHKSAKDKDYQSIDTIKNEWKEWGMLQRFGISFWMNKRNFPKRTDLDIETIRKLQIALEDENVYAGVLLGEIHEYLGEWKSAYDVYSHTISLLDPISQGDVELLLKLKTGMYRCGNLNNYDNSVNVYETNLL